MKLAAATFLGLLCLQSHAEIIQHSATIDAPSVSVRAGEQRNGTLALEHVFSNTTTSAQDGLVHAEIAFNDGSSFGGTQERSGPSAFSALSEVEPPKEILPPLVVVPPTVLPPTPPQPPVVPSVPEPETYALMALGLFSLFIARRQRTN